MPGMDGKNGKDGKDGATGPIGLQGPPGTQGLRGRYWRKTINILTVSLREHRKTIHGLSKLNFHPSQTDSHINPFLNCHVSVDGENPFSLSSYPSPLKRDILKAISSFFIGMPEIAK